MALLGVLRCVVLHSAEPLLCSSQRGQCCLQALTNRLHMQATCIDKAISMTSGGFTSCWPTSMSVAGPTGSSRVCICNTLF